MQLVQVCSQKMGAVTASRPSPEPDAESGEVTTIRDIARAEKISPSYISRILRLTLLAPDIVEAILDGEQGQEVTQAGIEFPKLV